MIEVTQDVGSLTFKMPDSGIGKPHNTKNTKLLIKRDGTDKKVALYQGMDNERPNYVTFVVDDDFAQAKYGYYVAEIQNCGKTVFRERIYMKRGKYGYVEQADYVPMNDECNQQTACIVEKKCGCCKPCACQSHGVFDALKEPPKQDTATGCC